MVVKLKTMSYKKIFIVFSVVAIYFILNYTFLSNEGYTSMEDYIESTKDEFSYEIEEIIYKDEWTGYHIKMVSGEWLDIKKVSEVNWWHHVDIIIPKNTISKPLDFKFRFLGKKFNKVFCEGI